MATQNKLVKVEKTLQPHFRPYLLNEIDHMHEQRASMSFKVIYFCQQ